jgi:hypothetical protein
MNLKFWKKDDLALPELNNSFSRNELGLKSDTALDLSAQFEPGQQFQAPPMPPQFQTQPFTPSTPPFTPAQTPAFDEPPHNSVNKDLEIIAAKLDTIRAQLEMLNARVANLEQHNNQVQPKRPWY